MQIDRRITTYCTERYALKLISDQTVEDILIREIPNVIGINISIVYFKASITYVNGKFCGTSAVRKSSGKGKSWPEVRV